MMRQERANERRRREATMKRWLTSDAARDAVLCSLSLSRAVAAAAAITVDLLPCNVRLLSLRS